MILKEIRGCSQRFDAMATLAIKTLGMMSLARYVFLWLAITTAEWQLQPALMCAAFIAASYLLHKSVSPYLGFGFDYKILQHPSDFVPLPKWMAHHGDLELTGSEYEYFSKKMAPESIAMMSGIISLNGKLTNYDAINLTLFNAMYSYPKELKEQELKKADQIKAKLKEGGG